MGMCRGLKYIKVGSLIAPIIRWFNLRHCCVAVFHESGELVHDDRLILTKKGPQERFRALSGGDGEKGPVALQSPLSGLCCVRTAAPSKE